VEAGAASGIASDLCRLMAQLEDSCTSDGAVDRLSYLAVALAESHPRASARSVLGQVLRLHGQARVMLGGRLRLSQQRHLYRIESELLAHACLLLGDLNNDELADRCGVVALRYAEEAGSNEALACTALAKTYRWQNRLFESAEIARRGYERSPAAPVRVQLAAQEANAAALFGDVGRAREAANRAERDAEAVADSGVSAWSFARGRQAVFALSVANQTGDPAGALRAASMAEQGWADGEPRVAANWAQVRIGAAIAYLTLGALDAAVAEVEPVFTLEPELRIATVTAYTTAVGRQLGGARYRDSRPAQELQQKVREFNTAALPGELSKAGHR
jgi:tetratricopeptide (TPR) repeat protein